MKKGILALNSEDFVTFQQWIQLDLESVSWQGRYEREFEQFWKHVFLSDRPLHDTLDLLQFIKSKAPKGPLGAWIGWLSDRLVSYVFVHYPVTLRELSHHAGIGFSDLSTLLRNFFSEIFPQHEEYFNTVFQTTHVISGHIDLCFADIAQELQFLDSFCGVRENEVMTTMEVTLYPEWHELNEWLNKVANQQKVAKGKLWGSKKEYWKAVREVTLLLVVALTALYFVKSFNVWYEKYLAEKIKIFEPQFLWTSKTLAFKKNSEATKNVHVTFPRFVELENVDINPNSDIDRAITEKDPFVTESEVELASVDTLPRDLEQVDGRSSFDEAKGGIREDARGNKKAYRLMIKASNVTVIRSYIDQLMQKYQAVKADKVQPGTYVPGGLYYNLFVPKTFLREFLAQVSQETEVTLYESKARFDNPPGKSKVFVWVKVF